MISYRKPIGQSAQPCTLCCLLLLISDVYLMEDDCPLCNTTAEVGECSGLMIFWMWSVFPEAYRRVSSMDYAQGFVVI